MQTYDREDDVILICANGMEGELCKTADHLASLAEKEGPIRLCVTYTDDFFVIKIGVCEDDGDEIDQEVKADAVLRIIEKLHEQIAALKAEQAEKETANEILRNINKHFLEEHEVLRQQFMKKDLSITNLKEEVLRLDGQIAALKTENLNLYEASRKTIERQAEEIAELREVQEHILPMAKGYAAEHPVFIKSEPEVSPKHTNLPAGLVEEMWMSGERCMRQNKADALKTEPILHLPDFGTFKTTGSPTCKLHIKSEVEAKTDIHLPGCLCEGCNPKWKLNKTGPEPEIKP